jgi:hypothetical protein
VRRGQRAKWIPASGSDISALAQTQNPDATIQAISGHLSQKMLEHYSHVRVEAKRRAVEALDAMAAQPSQ